MFLYVSIVAEKEAGDIFYFPSRSHQPVDATDIASIRHGCHRVTPAELNELESQSEVQGRK